MEALRVVGIGGGTGLPVVLGGLRAMAGLDISAIVSVADDGGSSGRLRETFGIPAVGDLRNCMVALSGTQSVIADLFQHRFSAGNGLEGHSLGNLIVTALFEMSGSLRQAVETAGRLLPIEGRALPATESGVTLCAAFGDGSVLRGESSITEARRRIERIWLEPEDPPPFPGVLEAIETADAIVLGPGSLYTSILPNLLVAGVADAIRRSRGVKIYVCNLMTQPGETDGLTASGHLRVVQTYLGLKQVDVCVVNSTIDVARGKVYQAAGSEPVCCDRRQIESLGAMPVEADLLPADPGIKIRHDAFKLAHLITTVARGSVMKNRARLSCPNKQLEEGSVNMYPTPVRSVPPDRRVPLGLASLVLLLAGAWPALSQGTIATIAGDGAAAFSGDGGPAPSAALNHPKGLAIDPTGVIYVSDSDNWRIRRIGLDGMISTIAGIGVMAASGDGGPAANAALSDVLDAALDTAGNLYIADASNRRIRKITANGIITTIAGTGQQGFSGDGGSAANAMLDRPTSVAIDRAGNLYFADSSNQRVRRVDRNGIITTVAGNGVQAYSGDGGLAINASLLFPLGLATDSFGNLYISDAGNNVVRKVDLNGIITTVAGNGQARFAGDAGLATAASLNLPEAVALDSSGNLYIADAGNNRVRKVDNNGMISTVAGTATNGYGGDGGSSVGSELNFPWGVTTDTAGNVYISDRVNNRVRKISSLNLGPPTLDSNGILNAASFARNQAIAPGAVVSIFGKDLADAAVQANSAALPTTLGTTSVTINGILAPLYYVSSTLINAQAPFNLPTGAAVSVQVKRDNAVSVPQTVMVAPVSPGIFIMNEATSAGAILHASNLTLVDSSSPAVVGEYVAIYCTGLGALRIPVPAGTLAPGAPNLAYTVMQPTVTIAGIPAPNVTYSGMAPDTFGLYQINVQVPAGVPPGNPTLQISIDGVLSNVATIAVAR